MNLSVRRLALLGSLLLAPPAFSGTLFVDASLGTGAGDGSSWADAFQGVDGLQAALAAAAPGDQIWVAQGTYLATTTGLRTVYFQLRSGVELYGGFDGSEASLTERDVGAHLTILSGDLAGDDASGGSNAENTFHVVNGNASDASAVLDGFTITGGHADVTTANRDRGAGIFMQGNASPTVRNCRFTGNVCTFGGGAGYLSTGAAPTFSDCVFDANAGGNFGGAFDMANSVKATFERCTFTGNVAARAGAIEIFGSSTVRVHDSLFFQNTATGSGGGGAIWISGSDPAIRNCTIVANEATAVVSGGIRAVSGSPLIVNCVIDGNTGAGGSTGIDAQISPAGLDVTYTLTAAGYAGTGNLAAVPLFEGCGAHPFALRGASPGVDAGDNSAVAPTSSTDLAGAPRHFDVAAAPDSGAGASPLVDLGAYETGFDCNGNGVSDACDIASGASLDLDLDGLPDECACSGGSAPVVYCTAQTNSLGCAGSISSSGIASAAGSLPFPIRVSGVLNQTPGLLIYSYQAQATPLLGGLLCVRGPLRRTPAQTSGGSAAGVDCTGSFSLDFNAFIATGADPLLGVVGQQVNAQYWSRDPGAAQGSNLTDALEFLVCQ